VGHVDISCACSEASYFSVSGLKSRRQAVDAVSSFGDLLGGDVGPSFNGGGEAKGHGAGDFAEFLFAKVDERLS